MKTPKRIEPLVEDGLVDEVIRPLMSGKEAAVYVVRCGEELRCAKVYKEANKRGFRQAAEYQEGRKVRNTRDARAMAEYAPLWANYERRLTQLAKLGSIDPQIEQFRWLLEELRVSLFAQELRTPVPVSVKRLQKQWEGIQFG